MLTAFFTQTFTDITLWPVSINATLNSTVIFTCEAIADELIFRVNGEQANHENVMRRGFNDSTSGTGGSSGLRIGKLQAIAYDFNNNTIISCRASTDNPPTVVSSHALLLIQGSEYLFWSIRFYCISFLRFIS